MEQQLKRRLVGAIVLVSLAVIFIPVILEGPDDEWTPRDHAVPVPPRVDYRAAMELPLPETQPEAETAPAVVTEQAPAIPEPEPEPPASIVAEPPAKTTVETQPAAQPAPEPGQLAAGWYAQLGSFSQPENAAGLRDKIGTAGFTAHLQQVAAGQGTSYRVLAGPESTREGAEQLLGKLAKTLGSTGIVIEISAP